jgi:polysaccharide export outer membrane protein
MVRPTRMFLTSRAFRVFAAVSVLMVTLAACKSGGTGYDYKTEPDPRKLEFQIGPLDQIQVRVWKNQDLSAEVTVRPDGIITLPLIGDVKAAGRTPTELQKEVHTRLGAFIRGEELVVSVGVSAAI